MQNKILVYAKAMRLNQWIKNLVLFNAILFSGRLFEAGLFFQTLYGFFIFCLLSSTSYLLNDIIDFNYDKKHPIKKFRPLASGAISIPEATFTLFLLAIVSLLMALSFDRAFFLMSVAFLCLHVLYSLYLKRFPVIDIFTISLSFMMRTYAGMIAAGTHMPIWLLLTIFFISLFMATVKRHAELVTHGSGMRISMDKYKDHMLYFLSTTFAALTIISYANFAYLPDNFYVVNNCPVNALTNETDCKKSPVAEFITSYYPDFQARKLMMITIPLVVYGISRYAQLLYEREEGERPEKIITTDKPLILTIFLWGSFVIALIYLL
jgi:decaprenyl-phosphate phosphoribosyltransferase